MLKIIIAMAINGYGYDPLSSKSEIPTELEGDISSLGMSVSDDTIRKYLKEAVAKVLPENHTQP